MSDLLEMAPQRILKRIRELEAKVEFLEKSLPVLKDYTIESGGHPGEIKFMYREPERLKTLMQADEPPPAEIPSQESLDKAIALLKSLGGR